VSFVVLLRLRLRLENNLISLPTYRATTAITAVTP
jgi:hypothetical protein